MELLETECEQILWPQQLLRCGRSSAWTPRRCVASLRARCQCVRQIPRKLHLAPPAIGRSPCPGDDTESCVHCGHTNTCAECQLAKLLDGHEPIPVPTDLQTRPLQLCNHCCAPVHAILPSDGDFQADPRREPDVTSCPFIVAFFTIGEHGHPALSRREGRAWRPHSPGPR